MQATVVGPITCVTLVSRAAVAALAVQGSQVVFLASLAETRDKHALPCW